MQDAHAAAARAQSLPETIRVICVESKCLTLWSLAAAGPDGRGDVLLWDPTAGPSASRENVIHRLVDIPHWWWVCSFSLDFNLCQDGMKTNKCVQGQA